MTEKYEQCNGIGQHALRTTTGRKTVVAYFIYKLYIFYTKLEEP